MEKQFTATKVMSNEEYSTFNSEMNRLSEIRYTSYSGTLKEVGVSYLGGVATSSKIRHSQSINIDTYCIYLASYDDCGIQVCGYNSAKNCHSSCLNTSGHAKIDMLSGKNHVGAVRRLKARLFFANKDVFMRLLIHEINKYKERARNKGHEFSVRLNGTSDLNIESFNLDGENILNMFSDIQFYDYTKIESRLTLPKKYSNYFLTWSIDGSPKNLSIGLEYLKNGGQIACVFGVLNVSELPLKWKGYHVVVGDKYDARYYDGNSVVGLVYKRVGKDYKTKKFVMPKEDFIIQSDSLDCEY